LKITSFRILYPGRNELLKQFYTGLTDFIGFDLTKKYILCKLAFDFVLFEIQSKDAPIAQLAEHLTLNQEVPGSIPGGRTND
jgi:hypothetical protein